MRYVYVLQSLDRPETYYVGITSDLSNRLKQHNSKDVRHTAKFAPWKVKNYFAFDDENRAYAFEAYLKTGSGRAFAKRHF